MARRRPKASAARGLALSKYGRDHHHNIISILQSEVSSGKKRHLFGEVVIIF